LNFLGFLTAINPPRIGIASPLKGITKRQVLSRIYSFVRSVKTF